MNHSIWTTQNGQLDDTTLTMHVIRDTIQNWKIDG
jgi:hypothetical protein